MVLGALLSLSESMTVMQVLYPAHGLCDARDSVWRSPGAPMLAGRLSSALFSKLWRVKQAPTFSVDTCCAVIRRHDANSRICPLPENHRSIETTNSLGSLFQQQQLPCYRWLLPTSQGLRKKDVLLPFAVMFSTNVLPIAIVDYSRSLVLSRITVSETNSYGTCNVSNNNAWKSILIVLLQERTRLVLANVEVQGLSNHDRICAKVHIAT
jgi:hypothetical protein